MAAAAAEVGAEAAEVAAPEAEAIGAEVAKEAEGVGAKVEGLFKKKEEAPGRDVMGDISKIGTGVTIGLAIPKDGTGQEVAQGATQTLAAAAQVQVPATGAGEPPRGADGRFLPRGEAYLGGANGPPPVVVQKPRRPLAESLQIAILVVLVIVIIAVVIAVSVRQPGTQTSFWTGAALGAVSGATVFWILGGRARA